MSRKVNYIASPSFLKDMYHNPSLGGAFKTMDKVPIKKIRLDKSLLAFQNEVDMKEVQSIVDNFHEGAWFPIMINQNGFLLDGQHRLAAAKRLQLKYVDVAVQTDDYRMPKDKKG